MGACMSSEGGNRRPCHCPPSPSSVPEPQRSQFPYTCVLPLMIDVKVRMPDMTVRREVQQGTAILFAVDNLPQRNCVVTAAHCVVNGTRKVEVEGGHVNAQVVVRRVRMVFKGETFVIHPPTVGVDVFVHGDYARLGRVHDVAVLRFDKRSSEGSFLSQLVTESLPLSVLTPSPGLLVRTIGFFSRHEAESTLMECNGEMLQWSDHGYYVASCTMRDGASGGPWLSSENEVVAIHSGAIGYDGSGDQFVPVFFLRPFYYSE
mmetsp:Transcript_20800/g.52886  ORF Transcript_20800/g.52886 Transcript_20800/m.52886 type:complete len:261 (+) Transcript_20800:461-1243(+)